MWRSRRPQAHRANAGFPTVDVLLERYAKSSGTDLGDIDFYRALATYKLAVISQGAVKRVGDADPERIAAHLGHHRRARRPRPRDDGELHMTIASPVDFEAYGDYAPPPGAYEQRGDIATLVYPIDGRIADDGSSPFRAEAGRYHLYYSYYCPWAQRPMIALKLRGLDGIVSSSAVDPVRDGRGWAFREGARPRARPGERVPAVARRVPRHRPRVRRSRLGARAVGPGDQPAGEQPLRHHDRRPGDRGSPTAPIPPSTCSRPRTATRSTPPTPRSSRRWRRPRTRPWPSPPRRSTTR